MAEHPRVKIEEFLPLIRVDIPSVPNAVLVHHARQALIEFCNETHYWVEPAGDIYLQDGITAYDLDMPNGAVLCGVHKVEVVNLGDKIELLSTPNEAGQYYSMDTPEVIEIKGFDSLVGIVAKISVSLSPAMSGTEVSRYLFEHYADAIANGAKAKILQMPNKEWTNPSLSDYLRMQFFSQVTAARRRAAHGYSTHPQKRSSQTVSNFF